MTRPSASTVAAVLLVAVTAVWGATFVLVQDVTAHMPVFAFLFWRFLLAGLALAAVNPRSLAKLTKRDLRRAILLGLMLGGAYAAQTIGLQFTTATVSGFITGMFVVFTPLVAAAVFRKRTDAGTWVAVGLAAVGMGFMSLRGFSVGIGELVTLLCAVLVAVHLVFLGEWTCPRHAYALTVVQLLTVAGVSGAASLFNGGPTLPPDTAAWLNILFLALAATAAAYLILSWAQAHIAPTRASIILTLEPVFAGLFGVLLAGDQISWRTLIGAVLILAAMYMVELGPRRPALDPTPRP